MKVLGVGMKQLPSKLENLILVLSYNNLGENYRDLKGLGEGMRQLPNRLENLELDLGSNELG